MTKYKRKLDDQAKIFSLSFNKKDTSVFRLTITLNEKIDSKILKEAVNKTLRKFKAFKVRLRKGILWHYFEHNDREIIIHKEEDNILDNFHNKNNNYYPFKVMYDYDTIILDYFHLLTDGYGANQFLTSIVKNYIEIKHNIPNKDNNTYKAYNAYTDNYPKKTKKTYKVPFAFRIKGTKLNTEEISINKIYMDLEQFKNCSKEQNASITIYIVSLVLYSIYKTNYKKSNKYINICIPIDLRNYFQSNTISNFVSHMMISIKPSKKKQYTFEDIVELVKEEFNKKLEKESVLATMKSDGKAINNPLVHIIPLPLKKLIVVIGSHILKRKFTTTITNLGKSTLDPKYYEYIKENSFVLPTDWCEPKRYTVCSYQNNLILTITSNTEEQDIEHQILKQLDKLKIKYKLDNNDINPLKKEV